MEYLTPSVTGISRFILVLLLFTLPIPAFFGGLGTQVHKRCSAIFFPVAGIRVSFPLPSQFPETPTPHDSKWGEHKKAGSCHPGPPPPVLSSSDACFPGQQVSGET